MLYAGEMDLALENEELRRRLALAEEALCSRTAIGEGAPAIEQRYRTLFDSIDEGFCIIEVIGGENGEASDYRFLETNASFERQTGLVDAVGKRMRELAPNHEEHWFERYARIAQTQMPERFEDRADALGRWYDVYAFPIDDPELRRVGILFRDIIERKRAEQELASSHHLVRTTFDNSLQIIQLFRAVRDDRRAIVDFEWLLTNKQWNDRYGSNVGKRLLIENPAVVESGVWDKFLEVMDTGLPITHEHYYQHEQFDGWFLQTIAKADDGILLSTLDITDRKRAEIALGDSEAKSRSLFERMGQGYCELELVRDRDGCAVDQLYLELNPAFERMFGVAAAAAKGRRASEIFPYVDPMWTKTFEDVASTGTHQRFENQHGPEGHWYEVFVYPAGGDRVVMLYEDITERKRAEIALRESEERQAFQLQLSDTIRPLSDPVEVVAVATEMLGRRLGVGRCGYGEVDESGEYFIVDRDWTDGMMPSFKGKHLLVSFGPEFTAAYRAGRSVRIDDALADARAAGVEAAFEAAGGVRASLGIPLIKEGRFVAGLFVQQMEPRHWTDRDEALARDVIERTWSAVERARAEAALRESEERFRQFADASSGVLWIRDAKTLAATYVSAAAATVYGTAPELLIGDHRYWNSLVVPEDRAAMTAQLRHVQHGEATVAEFRVLRPSDESFRWVRRTAFPLRDANGLVKAVAGVSLDVTEEMLLTEHRSVLLAELQHRVRNIMAIIRSIAARTADRAETVSHYAELLAGRLLALARVQALLTRAANVTVDIGEIVRDEVSVQAQHEGQYELIGPKVPLSPKAAEVLTLAVHELATNALKYGALSVAKGKIVVRWDVADREGVPWLVLHWIEEGAPDRAASPAHQPRRRGFGSELIEGRIPYELKGRGQLTIAPGGVRCHLEFPLKQGASVLETGAPQRATVFGGALDMAGGPDLDGKRVLVVEDEYYLATDLARALQGAGAEVLGPYSSEAEALADLERHRPDVAVVDINLGAGPSFKLAEALKDGGVAFVFVTGYDEEVFPPEFEQVARLQKPIQLRQIINEVAELSGASK